MEIKDARLELLEKRFADLEFSLQNEQEINSNSIMKYIHKINSQTNKKSIGMHRTCREARLADPSLTSGMHWIDPDGQGVGDDPIYVYCDMITGFKHDSCTNPFLEPVNNIFNKQSPTDMPGVGRL